MENCLFCKIVRGEIPSTKVYEDDKVYAFRDINPQAPVHVLVIPKEHMANILECADLDNGVMIALTKAIAVIARAEGIAESGFRVITNCGRDGAQSVGHFHLHLLGGKQLSEQMA